MSRIIKLEEFDAYSGNFNNSTEDRMMKEQMLASAQNVVENYLGYKLEVYEYEEELQGIGTNKLYLHNRPVLNILELRINNNVINNIYVSFTEDCVKMNGKFKDTDEVYVRYAAGYREVPALIKTTILRIATLMFMEQGENIGVTSKSSSDGNSRTFINYTNYDKYLTPLAEYKVESI